MQRQVKIGHQVSRTVDRGIARSTSVFTVISVKNSTLYLPGQEMDKATVDELCQHPNWEVVLVRTNEGGAR